MLALGANLTVDRTLRLAQLRPGSVQRPYEARATGGGKAVNVLRAASAHGARPLLVANLPGRAGLLIGDLLGDEGLNVVAVPTAGEARSAIIVLEDDGRVTVLNEPGPDLSRDDADRLLDALRSQARTGQHRVLAASGSLPPGIGDDFYAEVVAAGHEAGLTVIIDAARAALLAALPAGPDIVAPNLAEAEWALQHAAGHTELGSSEDVEPEGTDVPARALTAARALVRAGAGAALVSAGRYGLGVAIGGFPRTSARIERDQEFAARGEDGEEFAVDELITTWWVSAPKVSVANPIGAGDALVAGLGVALERGDSLPEAACVAVATAAASVAHRMAGVVDAELLAQLLPRVTAEPGSAWEGRASDQGEQS